MRLNGQVSIITGGGSGIGRVAAKLFAREGASVVVADINLQGAEETVAEVRREGNQAVAVAGAVDKGDDAKAIVQKALEVYGRVDSVFHCAGIGSTGTILELTEAEWDRVMAINVKGTFLVSRYAAEAMIAAGSAGSIVTVGSIAGLVGGPRMAAYNASKGAVVNLTRNMAIDLAPHKIRVNCLCPGTTLTPLVRGLLEDRKAKNMFVEDMLNPERAPLGRFAEVEEIAKVALFLVSSDASYVTGSVITADGGFTAW